MIVDATKCDPSIAAELEEIMRNDIFHSTLDWQTKRQFNKGAREAYETYQYMNSEEGKLYIENLTKQFKR